MIIKTINNRTFLFVEVPEGATQTKLRFKRYLTYRREHSSHITMFDDHPLFIIGLASDLTEDEWNGIVRELPVGERYENYMGDYPIWLHSAKSSGHSLLQSLNLNPHTTLIIEKK